MSNKTLLSAAAAILSILLIAGCPQTANPPADQPDDAQTPDPTTIAITQSNGGDGGTDVTPNPNPDPDPDPEPTPDPVPTPVPVEQPVEDPQSELFSALLNGQYQTGTGTSVASLPGTWSSRQHTVSIELGVDGGTGVYIPGFSLIPNMRVAIANQGQVVVVEGQSPGGETPFVYTVQVTATQWSIVGQQIKGKLNLVVHGDMGRHVSDGTAVHTVTIVDQGDHLDYTSETTYFVDMKAVVDGQVQVSIPIIEVTKLNGVLPLAP